ncbi:MAG: twin-arginine translocation signal domain-containing protein [Salinigranum sp.]
MAYEKSRPTLSDEERREFLKALGVGGVAVAGGLTLENLGGAIATGQTGLADRGEAIRGDLSGHLDASLLASGLEGIDAGIRRIPELRSMGTPSEPTSRFEEVTAPAWTVYDHLAETGFFASAESHLPRFSEEHIAASARELLGSGPLARALSELGFDDREALALVANVVTASERLSWWVPTADLPKDAEGFDPENVAPLHQRAAGGALLWIDELDHHLWQRRRLLTESMLDDGAWDVRTMLAGQHLLARAAHDVAGPGELTDSQLSAMLTTAAATTIVGQEDLAADVFRITDEMRAPGGGV